MATLAEAIQAVMAGLDQRRSAQSTVRTARQVQKSRPGIKLPNTGTDIEFDPADPTTPPPSAPPAGKDWYYNPVDGFWGLVDAVEPEQQIEIPVPGEQRIKRRGWGGAPVGLELADERAQVGLSDPRALAAAQSGQLGELDAFRVLSQTGLTPSFLQDLLFGESGGGGSDNAVGLAQLAEQKRQFDLQFAEQQREAKIQNLFGLVGLDIDRQNRQRENLQAQREAYMQLAPFMSGGRTHMGGFEPYGAYSAVANFAGVPFQERPIVEQPIPLGIPEEQSPVDLAQLRQLLGV